MKYMNIKQKDIVEVLVLFEVIKLELNITKVPSIDNINLNINKIKKLVNTAVPI